MTISGPSDFVVDLPRNPDFGGMAPVSKSRRDGRFEKVAGGYPAGDRRAPLSHGRPGYCFQSCVPAELQSASPGTSIVGHRIVLQSLWTRERSLKKIQQHILPIHDKPGWTDKYRLEWLARLLQRTLAHCGDELFKAWIVGCDLATGAGLLPGFVDVAGGA